MGFRVISDKIWSKLKPDHQQKIISAAKKYVTEANKKSVAESEAARNLLRNSGIEFVSFPEADYKAAASVRTQVINKLKGSYISSKMIDTLDKEAR